MGPVLIRTLVFITFLTLSALMGCGGGGSDSSSGGGASASAEAVIFRLNTAPVTAPAQYGLFVGNSEGGATTNLSPMSNLNGDVDAQYRISPDKQWVAYLADAETDQLFELYVSRLDGVVIGQKLSPTALNNSRTIDNIVWSPDSTQVAYVSDQEVAGTWELYVSTVNGAIGVKVSADPQTGRESNTDVIRRYDTSPTVSAERTSDVVQWAPDGSRLAYLADWKTNQAFQLYTTTPNGNANVVEISGADAGAGIPWKNKRESFAWAPDSSKIAYRSDYNMLNIFKLYVADPAVAGAALNVSDVGPYDAVDEFSWAPDSSRIAYTIDNATVNVGLYTVQPDGQARAKVSGMFLHASIPDFGYFAWAPDSSSLAYSADQNVNEKYELFTTFPDTAGNDTLVSGVTSYTGLQSTGKYREFSWSPDSSYIAYLSYQQQGNVRELFASKPDGSSNVKLSGPLSSSKDIWKFNWSPDSSHVAYIADQNSDGVDEVFASPIAGARETAETDGGGPVSNPRLNPDLVTGGDVSADYLQWSEDAQRVFYFADQEIDGQVAFYSSSRDGNIHNVKISTRFAISFAGDIYPGLTSNCSGCHNPGSAQPWYAASVSDTYNNMNAAGYFAGYFIVEKLDGTRSHSGGTYDSIATVFSQWIDEGANNN